MAAKKEVLISELFLESATNRQSLNKVFNFEIPAGTHHAGGSVFGIIRIGSIHPVYDRLIKNIIDSIEDFYQEEHGLDFAEEFEKALQALNKNISDFINRESNPVDLEKLNIAITASSEENMSFSFVGDVRIIYFQKQSGKGFQVFDLVKSLKADGAKINANKLFENVMDGSIKPGDVVLICGPNLLESFNEEELQPILVNKIPDEVVVHLREYLLKEPIKSGYTAVILKYHQEEVLVAEGVTAKNFEGSLEHLKSTEEETKRYLLGKGTSKLGGLLAKIASGISRVMPKTNPKFQEKIAPPPKELGQRIIKFFQWLGAVTVQAAAGTRDFFKNSFVMITNYRGKRSEVLSSYKSKAHGLGNESVSRFNRLGKYNKYIFIGALILVVVFAGSIVYLKYKQNRDQEAQIYNDQVIAISQKKDEAESSIIYGDETRAWELVEEALALTYELPDKKSEHRQIKQSMLDDIEELKKQLRHDVSPADLTKVTALPLDADGQTINFEFLLFTNPNNYLILSKEKDLYTWRSAESAWQEVSWNNEEIINILTTAKSANDKYLVIDSRPGVSEINISDLSWQELEFGTSDQQKSFIQAAVYNSRIYVLDSEANQIFRHNRSSNSFSAGSAWVSSTGVDLSDGTSLTIDGSIYVLKSNGEIINFYTGEKQNWANAAVDPPLQNPTKLWTDLDTKYLYILDPANKRVAVINKDGKFISQYILEQAQGLKDIYVDASARKIWVLADNGVWNFSAQE